MNSRYFFRLAWSNIKQNRRTYLPYLITCVITTSMYYMINSLSHNPGLQELMGAEAVKMVLNLGTIVTGLFACIFLFYTNSFLMKRRKMEFGLYNMLGMEKRHLSFTVFLENCYLYLFGMAAGIGIGMALDKALYLALNRVLGGSVTLGFSISANAVGTTLLLFGAIYVAIFLNSVRILQFAKPIELLQGTRKGEREPKTRWLLTLLGILCMGSGYFLALRVQDPVESLLMFFVAVVLVIIGTYLLFTTGSIALLKLLKRNKGYYYKTRHFISVSGMIYRMKQNAVGLANICILSTMVLVMVSATSSLMIGMEDLIQTMYPYQYLMILPEEQPQEHRELIERLQGYMEEEGVEIGEEAEYCALTIAAMMQEDTFFVPERNQSDSLGGGYCYLVLIPLSDYTAWSGETVSLSDQELLIYSSNGSRMGESLELLKQEYTVTQQLKDFLAVDSVSNSIYPWYGIVVSDTAFWQLNEQQRMLDEGEFVSIPKLYYGCSRAEGSEETLFYEKMSAAAKRLVDSVTDPQGNIEVGIGYSSSQGVRSSMLSLYGSLFFLGIFLGILFIMATVLIIYYKQISEGYDDRERFQIMQKVGLSHAEVKKTVHSQVVTVFFLPLVAAGIHTAAAFRMVANILMCLSLQNTRLYLCCTLGCFLIFAVIYLAIYSLTARVYYRIVKR